jgi:proteasome lid subunit RPN8/RPN11
MQPPYQPATPQEPAPKPGQPNYPNIEKFNEQGSAREKDIEKAQEIVTKLVDYYNTRLIEPDVVGEPDQMLKDLDWLLDTGLISLLQPPNVDEEVFQFYNDIITDLGGEATDVSLAEEPDPSNPDKELNPDPDIPEPVEPGEDEDKDRPITADGLEVPDKIEIPERLYNDLMMMIEYSVSNDNEAGGFLIVAEHGNLGVVGEQFGKDREIVLEPNEQLHEGETLIGTVHMHPVTPTASTGDVSGYLGDENEKVMVVVGQDKSINFYFKTPFTAEGDYGEEISDNFEQSDMDMLAEGLGFIWYRGEESDRTILNLMSNKVDNVELNIAEETWPVEDLVKGLGIKGRPDIPEEYSTKKTPLRLQIPFAFRCKDGILTG